MARNSTNDLPTGATGFNSYGTLLIQDGGYGLYGQGIGITNLVADYAAGGQSRVGFDLHSASYALPPGDILHMYVANTDSELVLAGRIDLGGLDLVTEGAGALTISGPISGTGGLVMAGQATMTLTADNAYFGRTLISSGVLCVNGSLSNSVVFVGSGATLSGSGLVNGISVSSGGVVSPGSSPGLLVSLGDVTFSAGALHAELNGPNAGTGYDQLHAAAGVTLAKTKLNLALNFVPPTNATFKIIDKTGAGSVSGTFSGLSEGKVFAVEGLPFSITYVGGDGNDVVLTRLPIPAVTNSVMLLSSNRLQLQAQGLPGVAYVIEAAPNLNTPITWQSISTNTANSDGLIQFIADDPMLYPVRFYRVQSP